MRVIIGNRQHFGFSPGELCSGRRAVTLRAMVTAARVIGDDCLGALLALWSSLLRAAHLNDSLNDGLNFPLCIYCLRFAVKFFESSRLLLESRDTLSSDHHSQFMFDLNCRRKVKAPAESEDTVHGLLLPLFSLKASLLDAELARDFCTSPVSAVTPYAVIKTP